MKKFTSLILSLALGMSAFPALSAAYASNSNYDPNDLYEQFLRQLEQQDSSSNSQPNSQDEPTPELISEPQAPVVQPIKAQPVALKDAGQVSFTGTVVRVNPLYLQIDLKRDQYQQVGNQFKEFIPGDKTSWFKKSLLITSSEQEWIDNLIKAAGNDADNYVRITGWGVDKNFDGIADGISVNGKGSGVWNLKDPNNSDFSKYKESKQLTAAMTRTESDHYGFIEYSTTDRRVYMKMTTKTGVPILNEFGNQVIRVMYNEELDTLKWLSPFTIASVDAKDKNFKYLVRARAFVGDSNGGALYIRYSALDVVNKIPTQLSPESPDPEPVVETIVEPEPVVSQPDPEPISRTEVFTLRLEDVLSDDCGHYPFVNELTVTITIEGSNFQMSIIGDTSNISLDGPAINGVVTNAQNAGTVAGFNNIVVAYENGQLILGKNGGLPGGCPITFSLL